MANFALRSIVSNVFKLFQVFFLLRSVLGTRPDMATIICTAKTVETHGTIYFYS